MVSQFLKGEKVDLLRNIKPFFETTESVESTNDPDAYQLITLEVEAALQEISVIHVDTEEYRLAIQNFQTLTRAQSDLAKAKAELVKAEAEMIRAKSIDWEGLLLNGGRILAVCLSTGVFILVEREHPPMMRLVNLVNMMLRPND